MPGADIYREMLDMLPDIAFRAGPDGDVRYVNGRFTELSGIAACDAPQRWREVFPEDSNFDLARTYAWVCNQPARDGVFETPFRLRGGEKRVAEIHCRIVDTVHGPELVGIARDRTEEIALRRQTQSNELLFRTLAEAAPVAIFRADPQGGITYLNQAWADRLGSPIEDLLGNGWTKHVVNLEDYVNDPPWQGFTPANDLRVRTNRFVTTDGEELEFQTLNRAEFDKDGTLLGFVGVMFDITEQARAWRAYDKLQVQHTALIDLAPVGIFETDADGALHYANETWCRITGISLDEAKGDGWAKAVHPDDLDRVLRVWAESRESGEGQARFRFRHGDGAEVTVNVATASLRSESGEVTGFAGAVLDVTREEVALASAREGQAQLARLAAQSRDAIFRLDLEGRCLYASPAAAAMLDTPTEQMIGQPMLVNHHPDDADKLLSAFRLLADGSENTAEVEYRARSPRPPHEYHWLEVHGRLIRDDERRPSEIVVSLRDISLKKKLESELIEAKDAAVAATAAKSSFLANMSHEIRTPMNGVLGFAELLAGSDLNDAQRTQVGLIRESGQAMMRLLNDILDLSKVEAGRIELADEPVDLAHLVTGLIKMNRPAADMKGVRVELAIDPDLPQQLLGDKLRLRQIIGNILGNAVKFTDRGEVVVAASVDAGELKLTVRDTGIGIDPANLEAVFDGFSQADSTIHRRFGGTGLGLAISRNLAELMGGSLHLEAAPGGGTLAVLQLPLRLPDETGLPSECFDERRDADGIDGTILVAEDHPINQALIAAMLESLGMPHDIASSGGKALAMIDTASAKGKPYALVLMDIQMPDGDGVDVTRKLRGKGYGPDHLPIIALTANAFPEDVAQYLEAGMQDHVAKPIQIDALARAIREAVARKS